MDDETRAALLQQKAILEELINRYVQQREELSTLRARLFAVETALERPLFRTSDEMN